jgi:hypothetical protein
MIAYRQNAPEHPRGSGAIHTLRLVSCLAAVALLGPPLDCPPAAAQVAAPQGEQSDPLLRRWVGQYKGRPIWFDFFGDSLLVVNDIHPLSFRFSWDSIVAYGDTSFAVSYRFSYDRLIVTTVEGTVFTMSPQDPLARPLGAPSGSPRPFEWIGQNDSGTVEVQMRRGGWARFRVAPGGSWTAGHWDRQSRDITFTWPIPPPDGSAADSTRWLGVYDAPRALIFEETIPGAGITIFRRKLH